MGELEERLKRLLGKKETLGQAAEIISKYHWPDSLQVQLARHDQSLIRSHLAKSDLCPAAVDILFTDHEPGVIACLLEAGHLDKRRARVAKRRLIKSRDPNWRWHAIRLTHLTQVERAALLGDPIFWVRREMVRRFDLTPYERLWVCRNETDPVILDDVIGFGGLTSEDMGALVERLAVQPRSAKWWHFLTQAAKNRELSIPAQISLTHCGDATVRAALTANTHCCDEAIGLLFVDPSPTVIFSLIESGLLDAVRSAEATSRLVTSPSPSSRACSRIRSGQYKPLWQFVPTLRLPSA
jgi:hypothetical protein